MTKSYSLVLTILVTALHAATATAVTVTGDELNISGSSTFNNITATDGTNTTSINSNAAGIIQSAGDGGTYSSTINIAPTNVSIGSGGPDGGTNFNIATTGPTPGQRTAIYDVLGNYNFQQINATGTSFGATGPTGSGQSTSADFTTSGVDISTTGSIGISGATSINATGSNATSIGGMGTGAPGFDSWRRKHLIYMQSA